MIINLSWATSDEINTKPLYAKKCTRDVPFGAEGVIGDDL